MCSPDSSACIVTGEDIRLFLNATSVVPADSPRLVFSSYKVSGGRAGVVRGVKCSLRGADLARHLRSSIRMCGASRQHVPAWCLKADSRIACRAHAVPLPCRASKGLECVFPI